MKILGSRYKKIVKEFGESNADFTIEFRIVVTGIEYKNGANAINIDSDTFDEWMRDYNNKNEL